MVRKFPVTLIIEISAHLRGRLGSAKAAVEYISVDIWFVDGFRIFLMRASETTRQDASFDMHSPYWHIFFPCEKLHSSFFRAPNPPFLIFGALLCTYFRGVPKCSGRFSEDFVT